MAGRPTSLCGGGGGETLLGVTTMALFQRAHVKTPRGSHARRRRGPYSEGGCLGKVQLQAGTSESNSMFST